MQVKASPGGKDIVQHMEYDANGRESKKYLPYAESSSADGCFKSSALSSLNSFYNSPPTGVVEIPVVSSITPAYSQTVFELSPLNRVLEQGFPGAAWQPSSSGISGSGHTAQSSYGSNTASTIRKWSVVSGGADGTTYYDAGQLYTTTLTDENGSHTIEYKDKDDRVVLKQSESATSTFISTYYVYDNSGNLKYVIPPGFTATSFTESDAAFSDFVYAYHYDHRKRLIEKKVPGKGWEELVYNSANQLVLSRDAVQAGNSKWMFTKYDALGRVILTGIISSSSSRASWQSSIDGQSVFVESRDNSNSSGTGTGYTDATYPNSSIDQYHTINYYDDYSFYGNIFSATSITPSKQIRGLLTGTRVNILGGSTMLLTTNYYDDEGRLAQSKSDNHLSGTDLLTNTWNFAGELTGSNRVHIANSVTTTIANRYDYDHVGRKLNTFQTMNSDTEVHLSANNYNEIGQLSTKGLHNNLQSTTYSYNPRGWLKTSNSSQFSMELKYDNGTTPQYNGNISNQVFTNSGSNTFTYAYDLLNRLTSGAATGMSEALSYDNMGNIVTLNRNGAGASTYTYNGNRLSSISGSSVSTATNYAYDSNGNATTDGRNNKTIGYNILNLPATVSSGPTYTYDAGGRKLTKVSGTTRHYIGGIEYLGSSIEFVQTEEGIARRSGSSYSYEYNLKDHLGNTRVSFYRNPSSGSIEVLQRDDYYPFGMRYNTVAGSNDNKYLYNGKELQDELGQYDYGARFYDPVIGRWNVVDPLAEKGRRWSPYTYVFNNPMRFIDPDGMWPDLPGWDEIKSNVSKAYANVTQSLPKIDINVKVSFGAQVGVSVGKVANVDFSPLAFTVAESKISTNKGKVTDQQTEVGGVNVRTGKSNGVTMENKVGASFLGATAEAGLLQQVHGNAGSVYTTGTKGVTKHGVGVFGGGSNNNIEPNQGRSASVSSSVVKEYQNGALVDKKVENSATFGFKFILGAEFTFTKK